MRAGDDRHEDAISGQILLPPPAAADKSVLKSIAALDALEGSVVRANSRAARPHAESARAHDEQQPQRPPPEPPELLKAKAFRSNTPPPKAQARPARSWFARAATVAIILGGGAAIGSVVLRDGLPFGAPGLSAQAQPTPLDIARQDISRLNGEVAHLREQLAASGTPDERRRQAADIDALKKSLGVLSSRLEQSRNSLGASLADAAARLDRAQQDGARQSEAMSERVVRLEKQLSDARATGAIAAAQNVTSVSRTAAVQPPPPADLAAQQARKPQPLAGYILREVQRGVALIEGRNGFVEAYPGMNLPGAGRVQAIERRGGQWVVVTSTGVILGLN